ncbi:hypothetical protein MTP99_009484 [Tenebrio molitor]|nr:hypothetical protein MTP99_009484 [Tenebrio molitor]
MSLLKKLIYLIICWSGRPQSPDEDALDIIFREAATLLPFKDIKDLDLPSRKDSLGDQNGHKYAFNLTNDGSGSYYFGFNAYGLERYEVGELKNPGTDNEIQIVRAVLPGFIPRSRDF